MNGKILRASYDNDTITVYQAFNKLIAQSALTNQIFICPPFKMNRMTWIKPSFLWMMYRSGWATKQNQEHILAIKMKRKGFEWALKNGCLSRFDSSIYKSHENWEKILNNSPVRIQWDPERDILSQPLPHRSLQIGLSGIALKKYINDWIVGIDDITEYCNFIHHLIKHGQINQAIDLLPVEKIYPLTKILNKNDASSV